MNNMMKDLTFIIPVRIDSDVRNRNLLLVLDYLLLHTQEASFILMEGDSTSKVTGLPESPRVRYLFEEDNDPVFYRTRYLNRMTALVRTPRIAVWDTDVLVEENQILEALEYLRSGKADFVLPYNGRVYQVAPFLQDIYREYPDLSVLTGRIGIMPLMYGTNSYGGCFMANRDKYVEAGMENEHFYGWGPEDIERVKRWEILGYPVCRMNGPAFHFQHPVLANSCCSDKQIAAENNRELFRICSMTSGELRREVATWEGQERGHCNNIG